MGTLLESPPKALSISDVAAISQKDFREPDVCFMLGAHADRRTNELWIGADLVVEVFSETNKDHDLRTKEPSMRPPAFPNTGSSIPRHHGRRFRHLSG